MRIARLILCTVLLAGLACNALAISLGDPAPPLQIKEWVKGLPVDLTAGLGKQVYVIEFWSTWCPPCRQSIPHLTALQDKYRDQGLVVVGIAAMDKDLKTVQDFVARMGERMNYVVAYEDRQASPTTKAYMEAFKKTGIPQCFVVDRQGKIVWEGHPLLGLDAVVEKVLGGTSDVTQLTEVGKKATDEYDARVKLLRDKTKAYLELVSSSKEPVGARKTGEELLALVGEETNFLNGVAWEILKGEKVQYRDFDLALRLAKKALDLTKGEDPVILDTYARALWDNGQREEAVKFQERAVNLVDEEKAKAELKKTLDDYRGQLGG